MKWQIFRCRCYDYCEKRWNVSNANKNDSQSAPRDIGRDIGQEILEGLREYDEYKTGKVELSTRAVQDPTPPAQIRARMNLSQDAFAAMLGVSVRTVQEWEQGR